MIQVNIDKGKRTLQVQSSSCFSLNIISLPITSDEVPFPRTVFTQDWRGLFSFPRWGSSKSSVRISLRVISGICKEGSVVSRDVIVVLHGMGQRAKR